MRKYRIAYFTADCNYELVESTLQGLKQYVEEHPQMSLCVFDVFGTTRKADRNMQGYAIFELADLSAFDGLLVQGNQIIPEEVRARISRMVTESGIAAVSVDCPIEGCRLIGLDNRQAQMDITEHLLREHQAKSLVYLTGDLNNKSPNGPLRMEGFLAACDKYGIDRNAVEIVPCFWQTSDGYETGKRWSDEKRELPDAFVCANDEMAIGLIEALSEAGVSVPGDVKVTGFDRISSADLSAPSLSTVERNFGRVNYDAMDVLIDMIDGRGGEEDLTYPYRLILSESCGCPSCQDLAGIKNQYFHRARFLQKFNSLQDQLSEDLVSTSDLPELMRVFQEQSGLFGCDQVYLCVNDYYFDRYGQVENDPSLPPFGKEMVMLWDKQGKPGSQPDFIRFDSRRILPESILADNRFMIFYPLQSDSGSIGYLATDGISDVTRLNLHQSLLNFLQISMENVQKKRLLRKMKDRFEKLYVRDELTGLYNRFGLEKYGETLYSSLMREQKGARLLFADLDGLKGINDEYGHDLGDLAILSAARILSTSVGEDCFLMRYGGDEFLIIAPPGENSYEEKIMEAAGRCHSLPFPLGLSIGSLQVTAEENRSLAEWIHEADQRMYEVKRKKKAMEDVQIDY